MDDIFVQFQGFRPGEFTRSHLEGKLNELHSKSPYGSIVRAIFTRNGDRLKATLRIMSSVGTFEAFSEGQRLNDVSRRLFKQVLNKIDRWKATRYRRNFHDPSLA